MLDRGWCFGGGCPERGRNVDGVALLGIQKARIGLAKVILNVARNAIQVFTR
jgi:hypothetical protein